MMKGTKTDYILVRWSWVKSEGYNEDISSYDARQIDKQVENGLDLESDTLLVVTIVLVHHLDEVDSSVFNFEDIETVN